MPLSDSPSDLLALLIAWLEMTLNVQGIESARQPTDHLTLTPSFTVIGITINSYEAVEIMLPSHLVLLPVSDELTLV